MDLVELKQQDSLESINRHPWEQARMKVIDGLLSKNYDRNAQLTILDVGCGDTFVAESILEKFPNSKLYCIDIAFTPEWLEYYKNKYKDIELHVFCSLQDAIVDLKGTIDAILFLDVIEHIEDEVAVLKETVALKEVTDKTDVIITVPAFQSLFAHHDVQLGHYRRYNKSTLKDSLNRSGLESKGMAYFFTILILARLIELFKEKVLKSNKEDVGISAWDKGSFITWLMTTLLICDAKIVMGLQKIGLPIIGLSLFTIARKKK
ncbi:MAG: class I SAM-dependent methyltransferase [Salibacteraceae bacterium]